MYAVQQSRMLHTQQVTFSVMHLSSSYVSSTCSCLIYATVCPESILSVQTRDEQKSKAQRDDGISTQKTHQVIENVLASYSDSKSLKTGQPNLRMFSHDCP